MNYLGDVALGLVVAVVVLVIVFHKTKRVSIRVEIQRDERGDDEHGTPIGDSGGSDQ